MVHSVIKRAPAWALMIGLLAPAAVRAADKTAPAKPAVPAKAADPSGSWSWTFQAPNGNAFTSTMKLKLEGDKLTGFVTGRRGGENAISDAKYAGGELSFAVVREREGRMMTAKYKGKVAGDVIKGTVESDFGGETRTRDWEAKREAAAAPAPAAPAKPAK